MFRSTTSSILNRAARFKCSYQHPSSSQLFCPFFNSAKYKENMFVFEVDNQEFCFWKSMNCLNHSLIF
ncbi:unnamed protein product [Cuscuta campestris]|uniref:Uncharacterized protein n=1 Tax=Cuscuta campestris TaxID=132261 RepID=A0A484L0M0_9ASTE|nr:unnamed protein product [Cuscuta campestris]